MTNKNKFTIKDLEKALKYIKDQHAVDVILRFDDMDRLILSTLRPADGSTISITIYCADSTKMPDVTKTETLF